jgi:hypothetical protein
VPQQTALQKHTVSILLGGLTLAAFATGAVATAWYGTVDKPAVDALERAPATYTDAQAAAISQASMTSQGIAVGSWTIGGALFLATMVTFLVESAPPQATKSPNQ